MSATKNGISAKNSLLGALGLSTIGIISYYLYMKDKPCNRSFIDEISSSTENTCGNLECQLKNLFGFGCNWDDVNQVCTLPTSGNHTWREGESWDRSSHIVNGHLYYWDIISDPDTSNGEYTRQPSNYDFRDWADWDFTVVTPGTYYLWVRGYHWTEATGDVTFYWIGDDGFVVGVEDWRQDTAEWKWTCFGPMLLYEGGTLRVYGRQYAHFTFIDNILITDDVHYIPTGKGVEGLTNHIIG